MQKVKSHRLPEQESHVFKRTLLSLSVSAVLFANIANAAAPTPASGSGALVYDQNGVPIVDVSAPNSTGLSYNSFVNYDVDEQGLVINNALQSGTSQLAGELEKNSNFTTQAAEVVLAEVVGDASSNLKGIQEMFGQSADFILANPNGINVNGASFLNTNETTLTVGNALIDENGELEGLTTSTAGVESKLEVSGGLSSDGAITLLSPQIVTTADSDIQAGGELNLHTGRFNYRPSGIEIVESLEGDEQRSFDAKLLGAMNAGRINIVSTRQGAGINLDLDTSAERGLLITSAGDLAISGKHLVTGSAFDEGDENTADRYVASVSAMGKLTASDAAVGAADGVAVTADKALSLNNVSLTSKAQGYVQVASTQDVTLSNVDVEGGNAARLESEEGALTATNLSVEVERQVLVAAKNDVTVRNADLKTTLVDSGIEVDNMGVQIESLEQSVSVTNLVSTSDTTQLMAKNNVSLNSAAVEGELAAYAETGNASVSGNVTVSDDATINAEMGAVSLSGAIDVGGHLITASGASSSISGRVSGENITATSDGNLSVSGSVSAAEAMSLVADGSTSVNGNVKANDMLLRGDQGLAISNAGGSIRADNDMTLITNDGNLTINGSGQSLSKVSAGNNLSVKAKNLYATLADVSAGNDMLMSIDGVFNLNAGKKSESGSSSNTSTNKVGTDCWEISVFGVFNINTGWFCSDRMKTVTTNERWTDTTHISSLFHADNDLTIFDANTINITGSSVTAGNDAALITDEGSINILNATNSHSRTKDVHETVVSNYRDERREEHVNYSSTSTHSSVVKAVSDLTLKSALDINVVGSALIAGGTVLVDAARDVAIKAAKNSETINSTFSENNVKTSAPGLLALLGVKLDFSNSKGGADIYSTTYTGSVIEGGSVHINAGMQEETLSSVAADTTFSAGTGSQTGSVVVEGSLIKAIDGDIIVNAKNDIFNKAVYNSKTADVWKEEHQFSFAFGWLDGITVETADRSGDLQASKEVAKTNTYVSAGDIIFNAGGDFRDQASNITGEGTVSIEADSITQEAVQNSSSISANLSEFTTKFTLGIDVNNLKATAKSWVEFAQSLVELTKGPKESLRPLNVNDHLDYALGREVNRETVVEHLGFNDIKIPTIPSPDFIEKLIKEPEIQIGLSVDLATKESEYQRLHDIEVGGSITGGSVILTARDGDINLDGSDIESTSGETVLNAVNGDINFTELEENLSIHAKETSTSIGFDLGLGIKPLAQPVGLTATIGVDGANSAYNGDKNQHNESAGEVDAHTYAFLLAEDGSIRLVATDITANETIRIIAGEGVSVESTTNTVSTSQSQSDSDFNFSLSLSSAAPFLTGLKFGANASHETLSTNGETHEESTFAAGGDVIIQTENGNIDLTAPVIGANGSIEIAAENGSVNITDSIDSGSVEATKHGAGFNFEWSAPLTIGAGFHIEADTHKVYQETSDTGVLIANGNVYVKGENGLVLVGTDIAAGDTVELDGGSGSIDFQASITNGSESLSVNEFAFGFGSLNLSQNSDSIEKSGLTLPSIDLDLDFQRLDITTHTENGGSVAGDNVIINADGALNLHGTTITATNGTEIDVAQINAQAAISTEEGGGIGFQLGLGIPSYNTKTLSEGKELPDLPSISTGFQYYELDKQQVVNATIDGVAINPSSEENRDHEFGIDFAFGIDFSNANSLKAEVDKVDSSNENLSNVAFGAAAIATALTETEFKLDIGASQPGFGFSLNENFTLEPGSAIEDEISSFFSDVPEFSYDDFRNL